MTLSSDTVMAAVADTRRVLPRFRVLTDREKPHLLDWEMSPTHCAVAVTSHGTGDQWAAWALDGINALRAHHNLPAYGTPRLVLVPPLPAVTQLPSRDPKLGTGTSGP